MNNIIFLIVCVCLVASSVGTINANCTNSLLSIRSITGYCNNLENPTLGTPNMNLLRSLPANYGSNWLQNIMTPNARLISNKLALKNTENILNKHGINVFESFFGQFVNHDKQHSFTLNTATDPSYQVSLPEDDLWYNDVNNSKNFVQVRDTLTVNVSGQREVPSISTSFMDLSTVYGSDDATANALRTLVNGRLKLSNQTISFGPGTPVLTFTNMLPNKLQTGLEPNPNNFQPAFDAQVLVSGDSRVNENLGLAYVTWLFVLEHNKLADQAKLANPLWNDEEVYQYARKMNIAQYQHIIANEYMPEILGEDLIELIPEYHGYKKNVNPTTSIEFASAAFRYGHSSIRTYPFIAPNGSPVPIAFPCGVFLDIVCPPGVPVYVTVNGLPTAAQLGGPLTVGSVTYMAQTPGNVWRGLLYTKSEAIDSKIDKALRDIVFANAVGNVLDIYVVDIMRGRFNGLPSYYDLRYNYYGYGRQNNNRKGRDLYKLPGCIKGNTDLVPDSVECFRFTEDPDDAAKLKELYEKVTNIDAIVGLLAESHENDVFIPRITANIIAEEYVRSRDGDRFWYAADGVLTVDELASVYNRSLAHIIRDNFPGVVVPDNAFRVPN